MNELSSEFVAIQVRNIEMDPEVAREYERQRAHLEKTVFELKKQVARETQFSQEENMRIMQENMGLVRQINELRKEMRDIRMRQREQVGEQD